MSRKLKRNLVAGSCRLQFLPEAEHFVLWMDIQEI